MRLRGLQFRIDCQRQLAKNNLDSCIRIAAMMHDSFYSMRCEMVHLNNPDYAEPLPEYKGTMSSISAIITARKNNIISE